jgi:formylglycine-generating enzyme required for sulfatase activity
MIDHVHALPEGYELQEYTITGTLGFGGFGISYSAQDNNLDKIIAIKEYLPSELAVRLEGSTVSAKSDQDTENFVWGLDRFLAEARVVARFDHPNIIRIHRFFEQNGTGYIVMEHIEGQTLAALLKERKNLEETEIRAWLWPVLEGLKVVHKAGFLHRDIKPHNIMMRDDGRPCLLDFGSARMAIGGRTRSLTSIMTPGYAPLEQYETRGNQGPWTDIYAMGAVMYSCISGRKPPEVMDRVRNDSLDAPETGSGKTYSNGLIRGVKAALALQESERPQSLDSWLEMLDGPEEETKIIPKTVKTKPAETATRIMPKKADPEPTKPRPLWKPNADEAGRDSKPPNRIEKWLAVAFVSVLIMASGFYWWKGDRTGKPDTQATNTAPAISPEVDGNAVKETVIDRDAAKTPETREEALSRIEPGVEEKEPGEFVAGQVFRDCDECPEMVVIPAGSFLMGSPVSEKNRTDDEGPQHQVTIGKPFAMARFEVTFEEYEVFAKDTTNATAKIPMAEGYGRHPVSNVSWADAVAYTKWLSKRTGKNYRLPSEAEWEYAARAGASSAYWWGNDIGRNRANCVGCDSQWEKKQTAPVGSFAANAFGLYDIHGNIQEWTQDCEHDSYEGAPSNGEAWVVDGDCDSRKLRGGSWINRPPTLRASSRQSYQASFRNVDVGLRVAQDLQP